jgi:hypothetical protein
MPDSFDEWIEKVCEADPILVDLDDDDVGEPVVGSSLTPEEIQVARIRLARWQCVKAFSATPRRASSRYFAPAVGARHFDIECANGIRQPETEQVIAATKARYAAAFVDITVLWKGKLY